MIPVRMVVLVHGMCYFGGRTEELEVPGRWGGGSFIESPGGGGGLPGEG